ncbi:MAG: PKD domain-containing protein [Deltaproteobacteria bacterium]|nr:PKD domain-containing protein [Deltaproteobacteria bacterium]
MMIGRRSLLFAALLVLFASLFFVGPSQAQYQGIWKDDNPTPSYTFYVQHYSSGATLIIYATDANAMYAFLADLTDTTFEADSIEPAASRKLRITFINESHAAAGIMDNTSNPPTSIVPAIPIHREFTAIRTMHSGLWKNTAGTLTMYVQDYETGSSIIVYSMDGTEFHVFLDEIDGFVFDSSNLWDQSEELSMVFSSETTGTVSVQPLSGITQTNADNFTYTVTKTFYPGNLDVNFQAAPRAGSAPLEVQFTDLSTIAFSEWSWEFESGQTSDEQYPIHTYTTPGTYDVIVTMSDGFFSTTVLAKDCIQVNTQTNRTISGYVRLDGVGLSGVEISQSLGSPATTDGTGFYSLDVPHGWSGTITPSKVGYSFTPQEAAYADLTQDMTQDFAATADLLTVAGKVQVPRLTELYGVSGVTLAFSGLSGAATTDNEGTYSMQVPYGWTGAVTPTKPGFTFLPEYKEYPQGVTQALSEENFAATEPVIILSGHVYEGAGSETGLADVTLVFSGLTGSAKTDADGYYSKQMPYGWSGTIVPSKDDYLFDPTQIDYPNGITSSRTDQDFTGIYYSPGKITISGNVFLGGGVVPMSGVTVVFTTTGSITTTTTDASGHYSKEVLYGWSGIVQPEMEGYHFTPTSEWPVHLITDTTYNFQGWMDYN